ncbi:hypothetical protein [Streptomyces sp. NPDC051218]
MPEQMRVRWVPARGLRERVAAAVLAGTVGDPVVALYGRVRRD